MKKKLEILGDTKDYLVLNKEAGQLSIPDRYDQSLYNLYEGLKDKYGDIYTVHRLDKNTSGVMVWAKTKSAHQFLSQQFQNREVRKVYECIVHGRMFKDEDSLELRMKSKEGAAGMYIHGEGKKTLSHYRVLQRYRDYTHLEVRIETGRTHQIRLAMSSIGHSLLVDPIYGDGAPVFIQDIKKRKFNPSRSSRKNIPLLNRTALHALHLEFKDSEGKLQKFEAKYPKDFRAILNQLNKWG